MTSAGPTRLRISRAEGFVIAGGLAALAALALVVTALGVFSCSYRTLVEAPSPDGRFLAYVKLEQCQTGVTAGVAVRQLGRSGPGSLLGRDKTTFSVRHSSDVSLFWEDAETLVVEYGGPASLVHFQLEQEWRGVRFRYIRPSERQR